MVDVASCTANFIVHGIVRIGNAGTRLAHVDGCGDEWKQDGIGRKGNWHLMAFWYKDFF